jgi:hypothetical protein
MKEVLIVLIVMHVFTYIMWFADRKIQKEKLKHIHFDLDMYHNNILDRMSDIHELECILANKELTNEERNLYEMLVRNNLKDKGKFEKALLELKDMSS